MPRSRYKVTDTSSPHFLTATINNWLPLFTRPSAVQIILDSWEYLRKQSDFRLHGYVILENHLHLIATSPDLAHDMQRFKSWTAREILMLLERQSSKRLLELFALFKRRHKTQSDYQVWEEGSHPQLISSGDRMRQKLDYIHHNPVKRGYVDRPEHWRYSSARNYLGLEGLIEVDRIW
jgi:REP element-mobilizing transposase RayT